MSYMKNQHLSNDQITMAVVDAADLPMKTREHLSACAECRMAVERFSEELSTFGKLARRFSPMPTNKITLPAEKESIPFFSSWKRQLSFGTAISVAMAFVIIWWSGGMNSSTNGNLNNVSEELWEDENLMTEISSLSENALPTLYMNITGEPDPETEDDFMEFVDPYEEDTSLS